MLLLEILILLSLLHFSRFRHSTDARIFSIGVPRKGLKFSVICGNSVRSIYKEKLTAIGDLKWVLLGKCLGLLQPSRHKLLR